MPGSAHHQILIVGGGSAGITVAAIMKRRAPGDDIAIVEPSPDHYYQPAFTPSHFQEALGWKHDTQRYQMNERLSDEEALTHEISDQALELACCYNTAQFQRLLSVLIASLAEEKALTSSKHAVGLRTVGL